MTNETASLAPLVLPSPACEWQPDSLVYVDPEQRTVLGPVEWSKRGNPKSLTVKQDGPKRSRDRRTYPFGTFRSMCRAFRIGGKRIDDTPRGTLEDILPRILKDLWIGESGRENP